MANMIYMKMWEKKLLVQKHIPAAKVKKAFLAIYINMAKAACQMEIMEIHNYGY